MEAPSATGKRRDSPGCDKVRAVAADGAAPITPGRSDIATDSAARHRLADSPSLPKPVPD